MLDERQLWYWISNVSAVGPENLKKLFETFGDLRGTFAASEESIKKTLGRKAAEEVLALRDEERIKRGYEALGRRGIRLFLKSDPEFPSRLKYIKEAPELIYVLGKLPDESTPSVAIVGSRGCSEYGRLMAKHFSEVLAKAGVCITSGLANGIDSESHKGTLRAGGLTTAVTGNGIGDPYPAGNWQLYDMIEKRGCIISEYPPGRPALKYNFPYRNRLISAMSDAVIVIEARKQSGTLHTVDHALSQGKEVFAVPGRLTDPMSEGCNDLIDQGSRITLCPEDILLELWGIETDSRAGKVSLSRRRERFYREHRNELTSRECVVFNVLSADPMSMEDVIAATSLSVADAAGALFKLCDKGLVAERGGFYTANIP